MVMSPVAVNQNPYASPADAGGYDPQGSAGIAVWSDGKYVVLHRDASFPLICLKTGEPATRQRKYGLLWSYPIDWSSRRLYLQLPLCESVYRSYVKRWWAGIFVVALPILVMFYGFSQAPENRLPDGFVAVLIFLTPAGFIAWAILRWWDGKPLKFVRVRDNYFWLSGADPRFLAQLPPWTSGS